MSGHCLEYIRLSLCQGSQTSDYTQNLVSLVSYGTYLGLFEFIFRYLGPKINL